MHMLTSSTCSPNSRTSSTLSKGGLSKFRSNGITTYETLAFVSSSKVSRTGTEWLLGSSDKGGVPSIRAIRISKPSVSKHLIVTSFPSEMRVASMTCGYTCRAVMRRICSQSAALHTPIRMASSQSNGQAPVVLQEGIHPGRYLGLSM